MRAAEYVRVSTEHQQYSIINQQTAIAEYAAKYGYEVVKTYSDPAKSGLDIKHRPGLQSLIDDVLAGRADFKAVLVLDVSRWGRFQDNDEAACYEFLCKRAGIRVHYCAEPFANDNSMASAFLKMVKRTMAAEYLRELSVKVHTGQCRLAANGFKLGGVAGYGLRRILLDSEGKPKMVLQDGERKSLQTDRVTYTLGPDKEVRLVRRIFSMFLDENMGMRAIARVLNRSGLRHGNSQPWDHNAIGDMLKHPKYAGCAVFNRSSMKLKSKRISNPREQWVLRPNAFPALVSPETFDRVQKKLSELVHRRSNERLLAELTTFLQVNGTSLTENRSRIAGLASARTYAKRFGSVTEAYKQINFPGFKYTMTMLEDLRRVAALNHGVMQELKQELANAGAEFTLDGRIFRIRGKGRFFVEIARCIKTRNGHPRWKVRTWPAKPKHTLVVIRLQPGNSSVRDFLLLQRTPRVYRDFTLSDAMTHDLGVTCDTAKEIVKIVLA